MPPASRRIDVVAPRADAIDAALSALRMLSAPLPIARRLMSDANRYARECRATEDPLFTQRDEPCATIYEMSPQPMISLLTSIIKPLFVAQEDEIAPLNRQKRRAERATRRTVVEPLQEYFR